MNLRDSIANTPSHHCPQRRASRCFPAYDFHRRPMQCNVAAPFHSALHGFVNSMQSSDCTKQFKEAAVNVETAASAYMNRRDSEEATNFSQQILRQHYIQLCRRISQQQLSPLVHVIRNGQHS